MWCNGEVCCTGYSASSDTVLYQWCTDGTESECARERQEQRCLYPVSLVCHSTYCTQYSVCCACAVLQPWGKAWGENVEGAH